MTPMKSLHFNVRCTCTEFKNANFKNKKLINQSSPVINTKSFNNFYYFFVVEGTV